MVVVVEGLKFWKKIKAEEPGSVPKPTRKFTMIYIIPIPEDLILF